jgi:NAD(P)-dependent dehydrogenase (short-subunit alcohol dehydrogenase family)
MLTRHLAREGAPNVLVNSIAPGLFPTKMSAHLFDSSHAAFGNMPIPLGRPGEMEDIVGAVLYFCSRAGSWTTGATLLVSGGMGSID